KGSRVNVDSPSAPAPICLPEGSGAYDAYRERRRQVMWLLKQKSIEMPTPETALPGRSARMPVPPAHFVLGTPLEPPFPEGMELALFGLGCFWGAERKFWEVPGVHSTSV